MITTIYYLNKNNFCKLELKISECYRQHEVYLQYDPPVDRVFIRQIYSAAVNWWPGVATSPPHVKPSKSDHLITSLAEVSMTFILYVQSGNYYTWTRGSEWTIFFSSGNVAEVITAIYSSETLILQIFVFRIISDLIAPS